MNENKLGKPADPSLQVYAGRCTNRHDIIANIAIATRRTGLAWSLVENPQKLFPKSGEVEIRDAETKSIRLHDWVALQVSKIGPSGRVQWKGIHHWRLFPFVDLSHLPSLDDVRRVLVVDGFPISGSGGSWIIRTRENAVTKVELVRAGNVVRLAHNTVTLTVFPFDAASVVQMPDGVALLPLYGIAPDLPSTTAYDWSTDQQHVSRVVHALSGSHDIRVDEIIKWLDLHSDKRSGRLGINGSDLASAYESLRSGELAKQLMANKELLRSYANALRATPSLNALLDEEIAVITNEERALIRKRAEAELSIELANMRKMRLEALNKELATSKNDAESALHAKRTFALEELERQIAEKKAAKEKLIEKNLKEVKKALDQDIEALTKQSAYLKDRLDQLTRDELKIGHQIRALDDLQAAASTKLQETLMADGAVKALTKAASPGSNVKHNLRYRASPIAGEQVRKAIDGCVLLTEPGKALMTQFIALVTAGDVPVLIGPEVDDFLRIAEALIASGRSARLVADPTIICYEDLWMRAGLRVPTVLGQALELSSGDDPFTVLAVVENAELSGARFWYPSLAENARGGNMPRRLLICITVKDNACEEAAALGDHGVKLDIRKVVSPTAAAIAPALFGPGLFRELRPAEWIVDTSPAVGAISSMAANLDIGTSVRAARAALEAMRLCNSNITDPCVKAVVAMFARADVRGNANLSLLSRGNTGA
ncbi:hypothetical protein [Caballeronia sp. 15711]|uniref:hypothetical protein n=1 Tax=Caballeronia sp. 15711 TaxID=3391029 RepID=UPI0039E6F844